jgi:hypothetical protein
MLIKNNTLYVDAGGEMKNLPKHVRQNPAAQASLLTGRVASGLHSLYTS